MKEKRGDIISGIVIAIIAVIYYAYSFQIQQTTSDILGSRFFPQLAAILLFGLSVIQIVQALRKKVPADGEGADGKAPSEGGKTINLPLVLTTAALFVYYFLVLKIGFTITSILYLLFECWVLMPEDARKNKKMLIIVAIICFAVPVFLNTVFYNVFHIQLPVGSLFI